MADDPPKPRALVPASMPSAPAIATDRATRVVYATDNSIYQVEPAGVATPTSPEEVAALLRSNHRLESPRSIVARGGGTGTNGQSLTDGVVVDVKRHLGHIISIDATERIAVVEPGVVAAELNEALAEHGLIWAPHTSTLNRATVGGMIATDAAGKGSLVHGRTHRHVAAVDLCLADGTEVHLAPVSVDEAARRADGGGRIGELWRALLAIEVDGGDLGLPELARGFSGYGIDRLRHDGVIDPVQLVAGAEGTLGVVTRAWLRLTPLAQHVATVVVVYDSFDEALADSLDLASTRPTAIEAFDEATLRAARRSPAWPVVADAVGGEPGAVLMLEYEGEGEIDLQPVRVAIERSGRRRSTVEITDASQRRLAWKLRADAVGLLAANVAGRPEMNARPTAMVEDCAVPVAGMPAFISEFRQLLDDVGLEYGMFGHADVGCVHVRPALDLTTDLHRRLVTTLTDQVIELVDRHGGVLWGEHGRGFRSASVEKLLPAATVEVMREVKAAFDPDDLCNPGKLYRPAVRAGRAPMAPLTAVGEPTLRGDADRTVPGELRRAFDSAFACNGNAVCHNADAAALMCPSFQVTGDPALSPKGRADLLRAWLADPSPSPEFSDAIADNLGACLSCAACSGLCPVGVDVPELKSRFLERHHGARRRRPIRQRAVSEFERVAVLASRVPRLSRVLVRPAGRLVGLVDLPTPARRRSAWPVFDDGPGLVDVVIVPDVFTSVIEPRVLDAAIGAIGRAGYSVAVAGLLPSGKYDHVKGRRARFARAASDQADLVARVVATGARPVVIDPAVSLLYGREYPAMVVEQRVDLRQGLEHVVDLSELLAARPSPPVASPRAVTLLGHCSEQALEPDRRERWAKLLAEAGHTVEAVDVGCCGMAGIFGHERNRRSMSEEVWQHSWAPVVAGADVVAAPGSSCRAQAQRFARKTIYHPVELL